MKNSSSCEAISWTHSSRLTFITWSNLFLAEFQAAPVEVFVARHPTERSFDGRGLAIRTRPTIHFSTRMFSPKPGQRNLPSASRRNQFTLKIRGLCSARVRPKFEPVVEIIAHVVTAERQHRERVAADLAHLAERGGRHFRAHRGGRVHAELPS